MKDKLLDCVEAACRAVATLKEPKGMEFLQSAIYRIVACYRRKGQLLIAGNGGSLCDAMHFAEEMTGIFRKKRAALPAIALADPGI